MTGNPNMARSGATWRDVARSGATWRDVARRVRSGATWLGVARSGATWRGGVAKEVSCSIADVMEFA